MIALGMHPAREARAARHRRHAARRRYGCDRRASRTTCKSEGRRTTGGPAVCQAAAAGESNRFQNGTRRTTLLSGSLWRIYVKEHHLCADGHGNGPANGPGKAQARQTATAGGTDHQCLQTVSSTWTGKTRRHRHCSPMNRSGCCAAPMVRPRNGPNTCMAWGIRGITW